MKWGAGPNGPAPHCYLDQLVRAGTYAEGVQNLVVSVTALFLGGAFLAAIMCLRARDHNHHLVWSVIGTVSYAIGATSAVVGLRRLPVDYPLITWAALILLILGCLFWVALLITSAGERRAHGRSLSQRLRFLSKVALPGWRDLDTSQFKAVDRREASRISMILNIGAALVVIPGVVGVLAVAIIMNISSSQTSDLIAHAVGFYALLLATCWTLAYIITIAVVALVQVLRGNGHELTVSAVAVSLGTWAGFGAAGGVFVGALVPVIVVPLAKTELKVLGVSLLDSISPTLLLDISAAGAVFGFLLGEVISLIDISGGEENLYLKAAAPPIMFAGTATVLGLAGITPGKLATVLAKEYDKTILVGVNTDGVDPFKTAMADGLDSQTGWASVVSGFEQHGWNQMVDHRGYYLITWLVAILVVLFALTIKLRWREEQLLLLDVGGKGAGRPGRFWNRRARPAPAPAKAPAVEALAPSDEGLATPDDVSKRSGSANTTGANAPQPHENRDAC